LAEFDTPAEYGDLKAIKEAVSKQTVPEELGHARPVSIGSLQRAYSEYLGAYNEIKTIENFYGNTIANLMEDSIRISQSDAFSNIFKRMRTAENTNVLVARNHSRMQILFEKG